jgi:hypothetical protein
LGLKLDYQVELKDVFPEDKPIGLESFLVGIPRDTVLMVVSSLLGNKKIRSNNFREILETWFRSTNAEYANTIFDRLVAITQQVKQPLTIVTQPSALKIYSFANNHLGSEKNQTDEQIEISIFKAFLYQNTLINEIEKKVTGTTTKLDISLRLYALQFSNAVRYSDVINYDLHEVFFTEFIRAILLFEFLEKRNETKELLDEFCKYFCVSNWKEYIKRISGLSDSILKKVNDGHLEVEIANDGLFATNMQFLDKLAVIPFDELTDFDFKAVRERPIHKIADGKYRIISDLFSIERIFKALYFNLKFINEVIDPSKKVKDFRFLYTFHFSEKYALYEVVKRTFPKKYIRISGHEIEEQRFEGGTDFYVRNNNKAFIFESKDSLLNAALKESGDYSILEPDLRRKFYIDGKHPKAVIQLLNFIRSIHNNKFLRIDKSYKASSIKIYPIVIIHDRQLDVPGFNKILNFWFHNELMKCDDLPKENISQITVIDISTFILIHELLLEKRLRFEDLIIKYHEFTKIKSSNQFLNQLQYEKHLMNTGLPFSFYVKHEIRKRKFPRVPQKMTNEKAIMALDG